MLTKFDVEVILGIVYLTSVALVFVMVYKKSYPSVEQLLQLSTLFNTKGGIIMSLWVAWIGTLLLTVMFVMWIIVRGVDPQHTGVTVLLGMLTGQAFGGVGGVLFKTMTGEDPKPPIISAQSQSTTSTTTTTAIPAVAATATTTEAENK